MSGREWKPTRDKWWGTGRRAMAQYMVALEDRCVELRLQLEGSEDAEQVTQAEHQLFHELAERAGLGEPR